MEGNSQVTVSVPGRICLFGEHQDFLGLSVIAMAIGLRMKFTAIARQDNALVIKMPDIDQELTILPHEDVIYDRKRDYLRSVVNVLKRRGVKFGSGYTVSITSDIPINAGVSSSSAMVIGWAKLLLELCSDPRRNDPEEIAKIGHAAEVLEFKEAGGMMDHYTCSLGGLVYIDCVEPIGIQQLDADIDGFVLCNSCEKKDTTNVLKSSKEGVRNGVSLLKELHPRFSLSDTAMGEAEPFLEHLPERERTMVYANLRNRDICWEARRELERSDFSKMGRLLDEHHEMLRDSLGISTPKIEKMIQAAKRAGALGCKINGSGGGGTMIAYAPGHENDVANAMWHLDAEAWIVKKAQGVRVEK